MSQKRKAIRQAVVELLKGTPGIGSEVFGSRATPLWDIPLPAVLVYARDEVSQPLADNESYPLERALSLAVEARAKANEDLDDTLDDISSLIEAAMRDDNTLGGLTVRSTLASTEIDTSAGGEQPFGAIRLTFDVLYTDIEEL